MSEESDYDADILTWSERQAELLRRLAAGEALEESPDWPNIVEEIESVGRSDLHAVESYLALSLLHRLKIKGWPDSVAVPHWRSEMRRFQDEAQSRFTPSMQGRLDLARIWRRGRRAVPDTIAGQPPQPLPDECNVTLDQLLTED
jgi:hypothetical protein